MELFYTPGSPYARIVRIVLAEKAAPADAVKQVVTTLRDPASTLLPHNPVGRVPTLRLDDGTVLTESVLVAQYLDAVLPGRKLWPGPADRRGLAWLGQAMGFMEGVVAWLREYRRPAEAQSKALVELELARATRTLDRIEQQVPPTDEAAPGIGDIVLAVAIVTGELRVKLDWRSGRPKLAAWMDRLLARPSFRDTQPPA